MSYAFCNEMFPMATNGLVVIERIFTMPSSPHSVTVSVLVAVANTGLIRDNRMFVYVYYKAVLYIQWNSR